MVIITIEAQIPETFFFLFYIAQDKKDKQFIHLLHMYQAEMMMKKTQLKWDHEGSDDVIRCKSSPSDSLFSPGIPLFLTQ